MDFWLRSATLQIGGNRYSMDDLAFDFEVPFEDSDELTTATVNAYNLSANTRNSIKTVSYTHLDVYKRQMPDITWEALLEGAVHRVKVVGTLRATLTA